MTFNSLSFAIFLTVVVGFVWWLPKRWRNSFLLLASYVFYGSWDPRFLALIVLSTAIGYTSGRSLEKSDDPARRKRILISRVTFNLVVLGFFKYFNFFVDSGVEVLNVFGVDASSPAIRVLLPIGISFMTFEEISYAVDVYRGHLKPTRNVISYALFVAFFPKLVAGPILRPLELLPQIECDRPRPSAERVQEAGLLIVLGLFKKVVIADSMARIANDVFGSPTTKTTFVMLMGVYAFALQIYGDFSGYSDIARGASILVGFSLPVNFRQPYLSSSITSLWKTWHISLSSWLRDYLYIPLGGNRGTPRRTMINLFIVMAVGGLWHGAAWTFVVWGGLHGTLLAIERVTGFGVRHDNAGRAWAFRDLGPTILTLHLTFLLWIVFRATSMANAFEVTGAFLKMDLGTEGFSVVVPVAIAAAASIVIDLWQRRSGQEVPSVAAPLVQGLTLGFGIACIIALSGAPNVPFIYFQF